MSNQSPIDLNADPRVKVAIDQIKEQVPEATLSQMVRAAILYFADGLPEYQIKVYIEEQIFLDTKES